MVECNNVDKSLFGSSIAVKPVHHKISFPYCHQFWKFFIESFLSRRTTYNSCRSMSREKGAGVDYMVPLDRWFCLVFCSFWELIFIFVCTLICQFIPLCCILDVPICGCCLNGFTAIYFKHCKWLGHWHSNGCMFSVFLLTFPLIHSPVALFICCVF